MFNTCLLSVRCCCLLLTQETGMAITNSRHKVGACGRGHHEVRAYNSATGGGSPWPDNVPMWRSAGHQQDPPAVPQGTPIPYRHPSSALGPETAQQVPYRRSAQMWSPTWAQPRRRTQTGEKAGAGRVAGALSVVAATVARRPLALPLRGGGAAAPGSDVRTSNGRSLRRRSLRPSQTAQSVHAIPDDHSGHS